MTNLAKILMFLGSYIPLYLILGIRALPTNQSFSIACFYIICAFLLFLGIILFALQKSNPMSFKIAEAEAKDGEVLAYVMTYFLPFLTEDFSKAENLWAMLVLYCLIGFLYIRSDLIYVNPIFYLRFRLFQVTAEDGHKMMIFSRKKTLSKGTEISVHEFANKTIGLEVHEVHNE